MTSSVRQFDFINGPETSAAPTAADPSVDSDAITFGYARENYLQGGEAVADIAALKAIAEADRKDMDVRFVDALQTIYYFDSVSAATGDDKFIVEPTVGSGRWRHVDQATLATISEYEEQSSTPSNPDVGNLKFYPKTDNKFYTLDSSGNEVEVGLASGGLTYSAKSADYVITDIDGLGTIAVTTGSSSFTFGSGDVTTGTDRITETAHGMSDGDTIFITSDADSDIPAGLDFGVSYFIVGSATNDFQLALTVAGSAIDITDSGGGVNTVHKGVKITLPTASDNSSRIIKIMKLDATTPRAVVDGEGAETINGATSFELYNQRDNVELQSDGSNWILLSRYNNVTSHVEHYNGLGHGSTGIRVRTFSNHDETGTALGSSADTTNGDAILIYQSGKYNITYSDTRTGGNHVVGVSLNSSSTTTLTSLTFSELLAVSEATTTVTAHCGVVVTLSAGDFIKAHDTGGNDGTDVFTQMRVNQITAE